MKLIPVIVLDKSFGVRDVSEFGTVRFDKDQRITELFLLHYRQYSFKFKESELNIQSGKDGCIKVVFESSDSIKICSRK